MVLLHQKLTNKRTTEKLRIVIGTRSFQKGTWGSIVLVTTFTCFFFTCANLAKYWGLGCSSCASKPVKSHLWVISAEYRFHISKNSVAEIMKLIWPIITKYSMIFTPYWHKDCKEDSSRIIKQISYSWVNTWLLYIPIVTPNITQWTHFLSHFLIAYIFTAKKRLSINSYNLLMLGCSSDIQWGRK